MATSVAKKQTAEVAVVDDALLAQYAGSGFENTTADDYAIPYLSILQKGSPQVDDADPHYIEGARQGMLFDSVSQEFIMSTRDHPVILIPCAFERQFVEWAPRESGGGIKGVYGVDEGKQKLQTTTRPEVSPGKPGSRDILPNGNLLVDTRVHYVVYINPVTGEIKPAVISMSSTQMKYSRRWMSVQGNVRVKGPNGVDVQAPSFACQYAAMTVREENDAGAWFSWVIEANGRVTDRGILEEAIKFAKNINAGKVKIADPDEPNDIGKSDVGDIGAA